MIQISVMEHFWNGDQNAVGFKIVTGKGESGPKVKGLHWGKEQEKVHLE